MGVPSLNDLAVDGTLNTTNQPTNQPLNIRHMYNGEFYTVISRAKDTFASSAVCWRGLRDCSLIYWHRSPGSPGLLHESALHSTLTPTRMTKQFRAMIIEINNELEVFVQISKTDVGFGNNRGRRPRLLQNPTRSSISAQIPPTSCLFLFYYN